jgi:osmotically-inducible protein OsmY
MTLKTDSTSMRTAWAVWLLLLSSIPGWTQGAASHQRPAAAPAKKSTGTARSSDADLEAAIRAKFAKSKSATEFTVRVQNGVATIDGKTDVVQHKAAATRMAKTAGAVAVNNRVQVSDAAKKKASGNLEEGRRRAQVKRSEPRDNRK